VIDSTEVGTGLASFLADRLGRMTRVSGPQARKVSGKDSSCHPDTLSPLSRGPLPHHPSPIAHHPRLIVSPFLFNRKTKSDLGWAIIGVIDGGRIKEYADDMGWAGGGDDITRIYRHQLAACTYEVLPGPGKRLRWSVPPSRGHDDLLISTALTARLDEIGWRDRMARGTSGS
jgi:hypothetical protein